MVIVTPIQMGVKFKPPSLILSYTSSADENTKLRRRSMPIRGLGKNSDCYAEAEKMKSRHEKQSEAKSMLQGLVNFVPGLSCSIHATWSMGLAHRL